jgi:hypothetical protein
LFIQSLIWEETEREKKRGRFKGGDVQNWENSLSMIIVLLANVKCKKQSQAEGVLAHPTLGLCYEFERKITPIILWCLPEPNY